MRRKTGETIERTTCKITVNIQQNGAFLYTPDFIALISKVWCEFPVTRSCKCAREVELINRLKNPKVLNDPFAYNLVRKNLTDFYDILNHTVNNIC